MKRHIFCALLFLVFAGLHSKVNAQQIPPRQGYVLAQGFTVQQDSLTPAAYVTITNKRSRLGTISGENGFFAIHMQRGDTLEFTAVNLETATYVLPAYYVFDRVAVRAILRTRVYQLNEITVRPYSEKQFKKDLLGLQLPDNEPELQLPRIPRLATPSAVAQSGLGVGVSASGPLTALYNRFSKQAKSRKKLAIMTAADTRKKQYAAKLNRDFMSRVTGLESQALEDFITYCTLDEDFVLEANEYDLAMAIQDCLKNFKSTRN